MRPDLTKEIAAEEFNNYYWLKEELQSFCREHEMSAAGSKIELTERIARFLTTGEKLKPQRRKQPAGKKQVSEAPLSLDTIITEDHRCSQQVRAFFTSIIPKFHFSTYIQQFFKENTGKTYQDVVTAWYKEAERKKDPAYKKNKLAPQFEYNQFTRDYFADPQNKGKSREDAIKAWKKVKSLPGDNTYKPLQT
jgi:hypothetical protein